MTPTRLFSFLTLAVALGSGAAAQDRLDVDRLVASPSLSGPAARGVRMSPDGGLVTFLKGKEDRAEQTDLWAYDVRTGETRLLVDSDDLLPEGGERLDEVERARRERQRISTTGIVEYQWSPDGEALLFPVSGDVYYLRLGAEPLRITATEATETDARISPKGGYVSYVRERNLYVYDLAASAERPISTGGGGAIGFGQAQGVVQEELGRDTGYWWAPDDTAIAFTRIDESGVEIVERPEFSADGARVVEQRYPFAGKANAVVQLFVSTLGPTTHVAEIDLGAETDIYLARLHWAPSAEFLFVERLSRDQKRLDLLRADLATGDTEQVLTERSRIWVNLHDDFRFLSDSERFLWASERVGYKHLYLYDVSGRQRGRITRGTWAVDAIAGVDEETGLVYFTGRADGVLESHLYSASLDPDPSSVERVTVEPGWHSASLAPAAGSVFIDTWSDPMTPPRTAIKSLEDGSVVSWIVENPLDETHPYHPYVESHAVREYGTLKARDGQMLDYQLFKPADFDPSKTYPVIIDVYGGPHAQDVRKSWSISFNDVLVREGYLVFNMDNRGMAGRGMKFEAPILENMGDPEVVDQMTGLQWLKARPFVDPERIGVYGWSYGGYMTLMLLGKEPGAFAAGVSIAPVTNWLLYDTAYTERYMGHPDETAKAYARSSPITYAANVEDPLLIMHGMADDNVFFDNTVKMIAALQENRVPFEMMTYPGKRHGIRGEDARAHLWTRTLEFFDRNVKG